MKRILLRLSVLGCVLYMPAAQAQLSVDCLGSGEPVYLIGGGPAFTTWNLEPIQRELAGHYRVCRWDMRGVGENAGLSLRTDSPVLAQWLEDMAHTLPQQPAVLWGHSWGALQALLFARQYPERVKALVLNNPVDPALESLERIQRKRYVHPYVESHLGIDDIGTDAERLHHFRSKIASYFADAEIGWAYAAGFSPEDSNNALNVKIWEEYRRMPLTETDITRLAAKIRKVIYCKYDVLMPENRAAYSRVLAPARQVTITSCAHFPWVEAPDRFYRVLLDAMRDALLP